MISAQTMALFCLLRQALMNELPERVRKPSDSPLPLSVTKYGNHQFSALCKKVAREAIEVFGSYITTF